MLNIKVVTSIHAFEPAIWDQLSAGRPFQSHRWDAFGERFMANCPPVYLLAYKDDKLKGRVCLWLVRNGPLPLKLSPPLRTMIQSSNKSD